MSFWSTYKDSDTQSCFQLQFRLNAFCQDANFAIPLWGAANSVQGLNPVILSPFWAHLRRECAGVSHGEKENSQWQILISNKVLWAPRPVKATLLNIVWTNHFSPTHRYVTDSSHLKLSFIPPLNPTTQPLPICIPFPTVPSADTCFWVSTGLGQG